MNRDPIIARRAIAATCISSVIVPASTHRTPNVPCALFTKNTVALLSRSRRSGRVKSSKKKFGCARENSMILAKFVVQAFECHSGAVAFFKQFDSNTWTAHARCNLENYLPNSRTNVNEFVIFCDFGLSNTCLHKMWIRATVLSPKLLRRGPVAADTFTVEVI
mmetsp:Transcript_954/g.1710  ORF Transcript_954/g.1710 Transcript_954/m.1710 type:complete len:163 (-) Transcript_954:581-1069(-)